MVDKQKPLQLYHFDIKDAQYAASYPATTLLGSIHYYWHLKIDNAEIQLPIIPDGATDLVLSPQDPEFTALFTPKRTTFYLSLSGPITYIGVCFKTNQVSRIFSQNISQMKLLEPGIQTSKALGVDQLVKDIQNQDCKSEAFSCLDQHFLARALDNSDRLGDEIFAQLLDHLDTHSVATMAKNVNLSERQFRRITTDIFGLSPKIMQRILRMQYLLQNIFSPENPMINHGYYDQSHMIKELKELTGLSASKIRGMAEIYNQIRSGSLK